MLNRIFKSGLLVFSFYIVAICLSSCDKEKETVGVVIVKYSNNTPVQGATVRLHQDGQQSPQGEEVNPDIDKTNITDANGRAEFTYDLEAILNVDVISFEGNDTLVGTDVIRLLREKRVTKTIKIN